MQQFRKYHHPLYTKPRPIKETLPSFQYRLANSNAYDAYAEGKSRVIEMVEWWMIASCNIALTPPTASMVNGGEPIRPYDHPVPTVNLYPYAPSAHSSNSSHTETFMRTTSTGSSHSEVFNGPSAEEDNYDDYAVTGESTDGHTVLDDDDFSDEMRPHNIFARESYKGSFSEASEGGSVPGADVKIQRSSPLPNPVKRFILSLSKTLTMPSKGTGRPTVGEGSAIKLEHMLQGAHRFRLDAVQ